MTIDKKLNELNNDLLNLEYKIILNNKGTSLYLKLNIFEKKIGLK